jgi:cytochrome c oxidase subunit II
MELLHRLLFLPEQASTFAEQVDGLHYFVLITTMVASFLVGTVALLFFVRFRRRTPAQQVPHLVPPRWVEFLFIAVPLAFFLVFFGIGFRDFVWLNTPPPEAMDVYVMGKQWMWKFSYPDGPNSVDVLRVPVGRPVRLLLTSRDVIHSFFVPEFRVKMDVLPGRYTQTWFTATKAGRYQVLCTEYCGNDHSLMRGQVVVMEPADFDAWLSEQRGGLEERVDGEPVALEPQPPLSTLAEQGRRVAIEQGCLRCHSTDGTPHIGPTFVGLYRRPTPLVTGGSVVADEAYLTRSMMDPAAELVAGFQPVMPSYRGRLDAAETAALLEFIKSLRGAPLGQEPPRGPLYEPVRQP